jgi:membrane protein YqaA with SNARE-associated domain
MLRNLYDWTVRQAESPWALWVLAAVAFTESSFFPIPPHALIVPMVIATPHKAWRIALVATVASVVGGAFGYLIGSVLWDSIGSYVADLYGMTERVAEFETFYNENGVWAVLIGGLTPFPYKVITILSGLTGLNFATFMLASIASRGIMFFAIAGLLWKFGSPIRDFIERRLGLVFTVSLILLVGGFVVAKYAL